MRNISICTRISLGWNIFNSTSATPHKYHMRLFDIFQPKWCCGIHKWRKDLICVGNVSPLGHFSNIITEIRVDRIFMVLWLRSNIMKTNVRFILNLLILNFPALFSVSSVVFLLLTYKFRSAKCVELFKIIQKQHGRRAAIEYRGL